MHSLDPRLSVATDYLIRNIESSPESLAWITRTPDGTRNQQSWSQIGECVLQQADRLTQEGIRSGDRVVLCGPNSMRWIVALLATELVGAVSVPLDPRLDASTIAWIVDSVKPSLILSNTEGLQSISSTVSPSVPIFDYSAFPFNSQGEVDLARHSITRSELRERRIRVGTRPSDLATILFTSGTSAAPKGVMLSHRNLISNGDAKLGAMPQHRKDHRLNLLPFAHAYARTCELTTWLISGSSMECTWGLRGLWDAFKDSSPSLFNAVPLVYQRLEERWNQQGGGAMALFEILGKNMRQLASGGAPLPERLRQRFCEAGFPIYQGYGLTETSPVVCSNIHSSIGAGGCLEEVGPPVRGVQIHIDKESRLFVRGDGIMQGYWNDPESTRRRIYSSRSLGIAEDPSHEVVDGDGLASDWLDTGDLAERVEKSNAIRILGRSDDVVVLSNGYKIHPIEMETTLMTISGIQDCVVIPSSAGGWRVCIASDMASEMKIDQLTIQVLARAPQEVASSFCGLVLCTEPWTAESGLLNFKGGKKRGAFAKRFASTSSSSLPRNR